MIGPRSSSGCGLGGGYENNGSRDFELEIGGNRQPCMSPSMIGSMTIVVPGVERAVVVFPATLESAVVTVDDVLFTVHRVNRGERLVSPPSSIILSLDKIKM